MEIGDRIRKRREELGMSQVELAKKIGYKSSINKIENDGRGLPQSKILLIAKALETTPDFLLGWNDDELDFYSDEILCGINAMTSLLQYLYDDVVFHEYPLCDTFDVILKKNATEITLSELEYNLLFDFICSNIPNYVNLVKNKSPKTE